MGGGKGEEITRGGEEKGGNATYLEVESVPQMNQMKEDDHEGKGESQRRRSKK